MNNVVGNAAFILLDEVASTSTSNSQKLQVKFMTVVPVPMTFIASISSLDSAVTRSESSKTATFSPPVSTSSMLRFVRDAAERVG